MQQTKKCTPIKYAYHRLYITYMFWLLLRPSTGYRIQTKYNELQLYFISKGKAVPLQAWSGPEGSRELRFPDYMTTAQDGGKVVSLRHRPPLPPGNAPGTHLC
jgi:hypothetical protein